MTSSPVHLGVRTIQPLLLREADTHPQQRSSEQSSTSQAGPVCSSTWCFASLRGRSDPVLMKAPTITNSGIPSPPMGSGGKTGTVWWMGFVQCCCLAYIIYIYIYVRLSHVSVWGVCEDCQQLSLHQQQNPRAPEINCVCLALAQYARVRGRTLKFLPPGSMSYHKQPAWQPTWLCAFLVSCSVSEGGFWVLEMCQTARPEVRVTTHLILLLIFSFFFSGHPDKLAAHAAWHNNRDALHAILTDAGTTALVSSTSPPALRAPPLVHNSFAILGCGLMHNLWCNYAEINGRGKLQHRQPHCSSWR